MKAKILALSQSYGISLRKYLNQDSGASLLPALKLGRRAFALGLDTLELARIHEAALPIPKASTRSNGSTKRAELFFSEAIIPIVETHRAARESKSQLKQMNATLKRRTQELSVTNGQLQRGITRRRNMEAALKKSGKRYAKLLKESVLLQESLRQLAYQVLEAQEDERKKISHELQNEIAQTLLGINVRLLSMKQEVRSNTKGLKNEIASTQRLVVKSAQSVRQVARKLRKA